MADLNTFLSLAGLTHYDEKIKAFLANADLVVMNKVTAAQTEIDNLEKLVGELPSDAGVETVIAYVNKKTSGIATSDALTQLQTTVTAIQEALALIQEDYLTSEDRTEIETLINAEKDRALLAEKTNSDAITTLQETHATDKAAIEASIKTNTDAIGVLNGSVTTEGSVAKQVADAVAGILDGAPEAYDTLNEIATWIAAHPDSVATINTEIKKNSDAIAALESLVGKLPEGETSADIVSYIQKLVSAEQSRAEGVESDLSTRIATVEGLVGTDADGKTVSEQISEAVAGVQANVDELEETVATKADVSSVTEVSNKVTTAEGKISTLEGKMTTAESDIDELQASLEEGGETATAIATAQSAADKAQETADAAKSTASANATAITNLTNTHNTDKAALEASIQANTDLINSFVEITNEEIDSLF